MLTHCDAMQRRQVPARLSNYHRYNISGEVYPCVAQLEGGSVDGCLFVDLSEREKDITNSFEDDWYFRQLLKVFPLQDDEPYGLVAHSPVQALVFAGEASDKSLHGTWSYDHFRQHYLHMFTDNVHSFVDELLHAWNER